MTNISKNKKIQGGIPCIKGTRVPVSSILRYLSQGWTANKIIKSHKAAGIPLKQEDILAALQYIQAHLNQKIC